MTIFEGRTVNQMIKAKEGALYVWCNSRINYPRNLAQYLGRNDLIIIPPHAFTQERLQGYVFSQVVYDHALDHRSIPSGSHDFILTRIRPVEECK